MVRFTDMFPVHFFIEMMHNRKREFAFIYEERIPYSNVELLMEEYGEFKGCESLASEITRTIKQKAKASIYNFSYHPKNGLFINELEIELTIGSLCSYELAKSHFNGKGLYEPLYLTIGVDSLADGTIKSAIMHELTHAYEDYMRHSHGAESLKDKTRKIGYGKNPIDMADTYDNFKKIVSFILYHINDFERNAYIAKIKGICYDYNERFDSITQALEWVKTTVPYHNYKIIFSWGETLCNETDPTRQEEILEYVRELSNYDFKTYKRFAKWLEKKINDYKRKFDNIIPKIAASTLKFNEALNPSIDYLIDENI